MKKKIVYLLVLLCCLSAYSSARQSGRMCDTGQCCKINPVKPVLRERTSRSLDILPVNYFVFSI